MAVADLVLAANAGVPIDSWKPNNCHEAAFGWMLMGKYPELRVRDPLLNGNQKAWRTVRSIANRYGTTNPKQFTGSWVGTHLYNHGAVRILPQTATLGTPPIPLMLFVGDVIFMGIPQAPHHSMVIVQRSATTIFARGFNNAGAFGGTVKNVWDPTLRDIADVTRWNTSGEFICANGAAAIHKISYTTMCNNIPDNMNF